MDDEQAARGPAGGESAPYLGRFAVIEVVERGPFGDTLRARDVRHDRPVRIRQVRAAAAGAGEEAVRARSARERVTHEMAISRLLLEAQPQIVQVYELNVTEDDTHILVTEDVPGGTLRERLAEESLPLGAAMAIAADVAAALAATHAQRIVHRNLKPANIWLTGDGRAKVGDFSLAQVSDDQPKGWTHPYTPLYASPEQEASTGPVGPASDQYALGLILFEMLTGAKYKRMEPMQSRQLLTAFPESIQYLVTRMLALQAIDRFRSLDALAEQIARAQAEVSPLHDDAPPPGSAPQLVPPGVMGDVSRMGEPIPEYAMHQPPSMPEPQAASGDVSRMGEPVPDATATPPPLSTLPAAPTASRPSRAEVRRGVLHGMGGGFGAAFATIVARDATGTARFLVPDEAGLHWEAGFSFRGAGHRPALRCTVSDGGQWTLAFLAPDGATAATRNGPAPATITDDGGANTLTLAISGADAFLTVNESATATIDLAPFGVTAAGEWAAIARCESDDMATDTSILYDHWTLTSHD